MTDAGKCATCKWWRTADKTCHAAPPVRLPRRFNESATAGNRVRDESLIWGWPVCAADDFCRAHEVITVTHRTRETVNA
jgi:hypothetical protein